MYKNTKETVKLLLLIIFILAIPLFFISLETFQNLRIVSGITPSNVVTNTIDELYSTLNTLPKNNDSSNIRKCLTEIFELMNKKDFNKLYALLTDDIKEFLFPTEEVFSNYMTEFLGDEMYSPNFSTYEKLNNEQEDVFIVKVKYLPYSTSEEDILNDNIEVLKADTFTIYQKEDLSYKFSFLQYIGTGSSDKTVYDHELFTCKLVSTHLYVSQTTFDIEFTNKSDNDMFINSEELYVVTGLMPKYYTPNTLISPHSTINIRFTVYTGLNLKDALPYYIYVRGVHTNGKVYLFSIPIKYPIKFSNVHI